MTEITAFFASHLTPLIANVGALATVAWILTIFGRGTLTPTGERASGSPVMIGGVLGLTAALLMYVPVEFSPGIFADGRGAPILLSGIVGGPVAALVTGAIAVANRVWIGGAGMWAGASYIMVFTLISIAYWAVERRRDAPRLGLARLMALAAAATIISIPTVIFIPAGKQMMVLVSLWPILGVSNVIGTVILGALLQRERDRIQAEAALAEQVTLAKQATAAKSKFIAAMSHEIRTPLNAVLGVLQIIDRKEVSPETYAKLKVAHDSGHFLLSLINQVLDFARIEANAVVASDDPFTVSTLVDGLRSIFKTQAAAKGIDFEVSIDDPGDTPLVGSFDHIRQILFNFLGNAVKFTDEGGVRMTAWLERDADDNMMVAVAVRDTGPGISPEDQELIFAEFGRSAKVADRYAGSGLGLSISQELARAIGGGITVDSALGKGATFTLRVPVRLGERQAAAPAPDSAADVPPLRILIAEDNDINQMIVRALLEKDGHDLEIVADGRQAVERIETGADDFDVVLMDIQMPVMDGKEATLEIRKRVPDGGALPIIALTANAFKDHRDEYIALGMQDVVVKPIEMEALRAALTAVSAARG